MDKEISNKKLNYINNRLGTNFTLEECKDMRIVFDLTVFALTNDIKYIKGVTPNILKLLDKSYVGFLSNNRNCLTYRLVDDLPNCYRYFKLKINSNNLDPNSYYVIPNSIDLLYTNDINIHIAEGTFDILSVYANLNACNLDNNYYYAVCGFGYNSVIDSIISMGINTGLNIYIYADRDKTDSEILYKVANPRNKPWIKSLYICRNAFPGEKDYGVPKDRIQHTQKRFI
jgi:hypothetical protein